MEIATFQNREEAENILKLLTENSRNVALKYAVGGISTVASSSNNWYWVTTGEHIDFEIPFGPGEPNNKNGNNELCLDIIWYSNQFMFNDCTCNTYIEKFICQRKDFYHR